MKKNLFFLLIILSLIFGAKKTIFAYTYEKTIPPVEVPSDIERKPPYGAQVETPEKKPEKFYSNDIENKANQFICPISFTIQQTFPPTPCLDEDGKPIPDCFIPYDVYEVREKKKIEYLSNSDFRDSSVYFGLHPYTNLNPTPGQENQNFTKLDQNGYGIAYRATTVDQQLYLKGKFIEDAVASLDQQKDTPVLDEQLAWDCSGTCKNLFNDDGSKPSGCRAVHVSEIACFFNVKKNQSTSYKWENGKPVRISFPHSLSGCTAPLPEKCYQSLYDDMPFISRGTVNTQLPIYNKIGGAFIKPTPFDKGFPLMAVSNQIANIAQIGMPAGQKIKQTPQSSICDNLKKQDPIQDKPSTIEWESFSSDYFFGTVHKVARTFKDDLKGEAVFPKTMINDIDIDKAFLKNFIPASSSAQIESEIKEESSTADEPGFTYPDPGYKDSQLREEFKKWFTPIEWQKKSQ